MRHRDIKIHLLSMPVARETARNGVRQQFIDHPDYSLPNGGNSWFNPPKKDLIKVWCKACVNETVKQQIAAAGENYTDPEVLKATSACPALQIRRVN